jgi:predicted nucleic acid-binding protein
LARFIPLDAGVVGLLCSSPLLPRVVDCKAWLYGMASAGATIVIPDITDYEVRRDQILLGKVAKLARLNSLRSMFRGAEVTPAAWLKAAEFWALVRRAGLPTAPLLALDGDAILAAITVTLVGDGDTATIATTNVGHLARFPGIDAREWGQIVP